MQSQRATKSLLLRFPTVFDPATLNNYLRRVLKSSFPQHIAVGSTSSQTLAFIRTKFQIEDGLALIYDQSLPTITRDPEPNLGSFENSGYEYVDLDIYRSEDLDSDEAAESHRIYAEYVSRKLRKYHLRNEQLLNENQNLLKRIQFAESGFSGQNLQPTLHPTHLLQIDPTKFKPNTAVRLSINSESTALQPENDTLQVNDDQNTLNDNRVEEQKESRATVNKQHLESVRQDQLRANQISVSVHPNRNQQQMQTSDNSRTEANPNRSERSQLSENHQQTGEQENNYSSDPHLSNLLLASKFAPHMKFTMEPLKKARNILFLSTKRANEVIEEICMGIKWYVLLEETLTNEAKDVVTIGILSAGTQNKTWSVLWKQPTAYLIRTYKSAHLPKIGLMTLFFKPLPCLKTLRMSPRETLPMYVRNHLSNLEHDSNSRTSATPCRNSLSLKEKPSRSRFTQNRRTISEEGDDDDYDQEEEKSVTPPQTPLKSALKKTSRFDPMEPELNSNNMQQQERPQERNVTSDDYADQIKEEEGGVSVDSNYEELERRRDPDYRAKRLKMN